MVRAIFDADMFVADGGLETWLVYHRGIDLPAFAAYPLVDRSEGRAILREYYAGYAAIAASLGTGLVLDTPTWRANPDWAASLGHDRDTLARLIDRSVELVSGVRAQWPGIAPALVSGAVGPRGDGYRIDERMDADQAAEYHGFQIRRLAGAGADVATAMTLGYPEEAIGIARAAHGTNLPVVISFTVETDGRLPCGATLREAIEAVDAATGDYPEHYMINCAHPSHFATVVEGAAPWASRLGGLRANASTRSHAELDEMTELDEGDPDDLASRYVELRAALPTLTVLGGCCGTDDRHVRAIATAVSRRPTP